MATIKNMTRRLRAYHVPELGSDTSDVTAAHRDPKTGTRGLRTVAVEHPKTITLCAKGTPGDSISDLPDEVLKSPELVAAERRGEISMVVREAMPINSLKKRPTIAELEKILASEHKIEILPSGEVRAVADTEEN